MKKIMSIELVHRDKQKRSSYYVSLDLPAREYEIRDAYQRARLTGQDEEYYEINLVDFPMYNELSFKKLDSPNVAELNFLAKRLASLSEKELFAYSSILPNVMKQDKDLVNMKDLINCTYGLDAVITVSGVTTDEQLGEFVMENELNEDVAAIPKNAQYLIDKMKVGRLQRISDGGVFMGGYYIVTSSYELKEIYDGVHLPQKESENGYVFRLKVAAPTMDMSEETDDTAQWVSFPVTEEEAEQIAKQYGISGIEKCEYLDFESTIPQIRSEQFGGMEDFYKLNRLAQIIMYHSPQDQVKFKAVLEAEGPANLDQIIDIAKNLSQYQLCDAFVGEGKFYANYLKYYMGEQFDEEWMDIQGLQYLGKKLLKKIGASVTAYGIISARGRSLYEHVSYRNEVQQEDRNHSLSEEEELQQGNCGIHMGGMS